MRDPSYGATDMATTADTKPKLELGSTARVSQSGTAWQDTDLVAAIDVGTTKVCTVVARRGPSGRLDVVGYSSVPSNGVRKGTIEKVADAERAVRRSIEQVQAQTGFRISSAFVGITGTHIDFENRRQTLQSVGKSGVITESDLAQPDKEVAVHQGGRRLLHAIRMTYSLDGEEGIRNPLGMHTDKVEAETHVISGEAAFIDRLLQAVENAGITVDGLVLEPLASGLAVLTPDEMERGALLVDIGGGTTDVVGFKRGRICYTGVIPVGGWQFTNDIAITFDTTYEAAEAVKLLYASTELEVKRIDEEVPMRVTEGSELHVPLIDVCQLTRERAQELARMVKIHLDDAKLGDPSQVRLVLTGGASNMPGMTTLMERRLAIRTRQGVPSFRGEVPEELRAPAYATGLGLLVWAEAEHKPDSGATNGSGSGRMKEGGKGVLSRLMGSATKLSPLTLFGTWKRRS